MGGAPTEVSHRSLPGRAPTERRPVAPDPEPLAERGGVVAVEMDDPDQLGVALELLDAAETAAGLPLVDESERHRLEQLASGAASRDEAWRSVLAWADSHPVGYGAVVLDATGVSVGDAATDGGPPAAEALRALLGAIVEIGRRGGAGRLQVWTRHAGQAQVDAAAAEGFEVERRLAVMGRGLAGGVPEAPAGSATVRAYRPGEDDEAVVDVLARAYEGTGDAGWDLAVFRERTRLPWFRSQDLLVAELPGGDGPALAGLHWLKRRTETQGEVYNLAVHPDAQGRGVGPTLLHAGLAHLLEIGCDDVLLWVDLANTRAVGLYESQGFEVRWQDLALGRTAGT